MIGPGGGEVHAMTSELERRIVEPPPGDEEASAALRCLIRLRGEGSAPAEIATRLAQETGWELTPEAVQRVLERVAGPAPNQEGGDPRYFTGCMGGG